MENTDIKTDIFYLIYLFVVVFIGYTVAKYNQRNGT
jgi:hypothetical protein